MGICLSSLLYLPLCMGSYCNTSPIKVSALIRFAVEGFPKGVGWEPQEYTTTFIARLQVVLWDCMGSRGPKPQILNPKP